MTTFGKRLRALRQAAGLSQAELAGEDLSTSYISLIEAGKRSPSSEVTQQLAARLGCSTSQLLDGKASEREERLDLEIAFARLAIEHGESNEARARLERLLDQDGLHQRFRDELSLLLGIACDRLGDTPAAIRAFLPLFERSRAGQSHLPVSQTGLGVISCYMDAGDYHHAASTGELALTAAREQGLTGTDEYYRLAATVMAAYMELGDYLHARVSAETYLAEAEAENVPAGQASIYWNAALLAEKEGRTAESLHLCERALGLMSELDNTRDYARLRFELAGLLLVDEPPQVERAADLLARSFDDLRDLGGRSDLAQWNQASSTTLLFQGDASAAEARARQALDLVHGAAPIERAAALVVLADALTAQGRAEQANEFLTSAYAALAEARSVRATALQWREVAERMVEAGDTDTAVEAFRRALNSAGVRDRSRTLRGQVNALHAASAGSRIV